jgi:hypothetical protein
MDLKTFLQKGANKINDATKDTKWWILYAIICFIVLLLFIFFFTKTGNYTTRLVGAYATFTMIFAIWSFFSISIDLLIDGGVINYAYLVSFVINAMLGMIILYTIGYTELFGALVACFVMTLIFIVWLMDDSDVARETAAAKAAAAAKATATANPSWISDFINFNGVGFVGKLKDIWGKMGKIFSFGYDIINGWGLYEILGWIFCFIWSIIGIVCMIIMWGVWIFTGGFQLLNSVFEYLKGEPTNKVKIATEEFMNPNSKDTIKWTGILLIFIILILILFSSQSAMRKNPMGVLGIGIVASIAYLGYIRFFKSDMFNSTFLYVLGGLFVLCLYLYNPYNVFHKMSGINLFAIFLIFFGIVGMILISTRENTATAAAAAATAATAALAAAAGAAGATAAAPVAAAQPKTFAELFGVYNKKTPAPTIFKGDFKDLFTTGYQKLIKGFAGLVVSMALIMLIVSSIKTGDENPTAGIYILNILIVVGMLTIAFNLIDSDRTLRNHPIFKLIVEIIFYIPCLLSDLADIIMTEYYKTKYFTLVIIVLEIIFIICYWGIYSRVVSKLYTGGGKVLVNSPISLNKIHTVGYYKNLSKGIFIDDETSAGNMRTTIDSGKTISNKGAFKTTDFNYVTGKPMKDASGNQIILKDSYGNYISPTKVNTYKYGISCWIYLNPMPSYGENPLHILNYGKNPTVSYSPKKNELTVNVLQANDCNNHTTAVYTNKDPPIQKWFNLVLNYDGGHLDVFLDSVLVQTSPDVISCVVYDALTVGQLSGLNAKMCNLIYFNTPLDIITIHNLYNLTKIEDIPDIPKRDLFSI